ncbi:gluconokinase [Aeromicrobium sp. CTD01-1L150]|uniref:gluconokinase n=1 Tax=Aeromicrobium sp. CTD01-1L150 TaxID=3341830 RepID=UPI0035C197D8
MGVSGTGKTVVGRAVAEAMGFEFIEGDKHHPQANIDKMSAGTPLDDDDRRPWLEELAAILQENRTRGTGSVLACSSLKRSYRDILRGDAPPDATFFLHLDLPQDILLKRMQSREHFMPASLLQSQLDTLEPLGADEHGSALDHDDPLPQVVDDAVKLVREAGHTD